VRAHHSLVNQHNRLCNACGIRYARRLKKDAKADAQAAAAAAAAQAKPREDASIRRSTVYSLLN
jgi:hypothetical protein